MHRIVEEMVNAWLPGAVGAAVAKNETLLDFLAHPRDYPRVLERLGITEEMLGEGV